MISSSIFILQVFFSSLVFDFSGSDIEKHIEQKIQYFQQFTHEEKEAFCRSGDSFSCRILFFEALNSKDKSQNPEDYLSYMSDREKSTGLYLYATEKWEDISLEKLKGYLAILPENSAKNLYSVYLKKLYLSGNVQQFMEDYRQENSPTLTQFYVTELLRRDPESGLSYLRTLKISFPESVYDTFSKIVEQHSKANSRSGAWSTITAKYATSR